MSELTDILDTLDIPDARKKLTRQNITWILRHLRRLEVRAAPAVRTDLTKAELVEEIERLDPAASTGGKKSDLQMTLASLQTNGSPDRSNLVRLLVGSLKGARR